MPDPMTKHPNWSLESQYTCQTNAAVLNSESPPTMPLRVGGITVAGAAVVCTVGVSRNRCKSTGAGGAAPVPAKTARPITTVIVARRLLVNLGKIVNAGTSRASATPGVLWCQGAQRIADC